MNSMYSMDFHGTMFTNMRLVQSCTSNNKHWGEDTGTRKASTDY